MVRAIFALVIAALNFATFPPALAGEFGTREEAIAMVKRVQEKFRRDGADATFRAVTGQAKIFHDRDPMGLHCRDRARCAPATLDCGGEYAGSRGTTTADKLPDE